MQLRPYQSKLKSDVYEAWDSGVKNVLAVSPTGSGKTVLFSDVIKEHNGASCAIAHRQELVTQISLALARDGVRHRIIGPDKVIRLANRIHMDELGKSYFNANAHVAVAGVDTLVRRRNELSHWLSRVTKWVQDECFPAGTLVDNIPIENIKIGDYVTAFDEENNTFEKRKVTRLFKNPMPKNMVSLQIGHHVLECTKGHPIYTKRGWVDAGNITEKDYVYMVRQADNENERSTTVRLEKERSYILSKKMRHVTSGRKSQTEKETRVTESEMYAMRKSGRFNRSSIQLLQTNGSSLLWERMFGQLPLESIIGNHDQNKQEICFGTNEEKQPNAERGNTREGFKYIKTDRTCSKNTRRERTTTNESGITVKQFIRGARVRTSNHCTNGFDKSRLPKSLQNRLRKQTFKNSNRSGRKFARVNKSTRTRCEERQFFNWQRVGSVSIFKHCDIEQSGRSLQNGYVYNIEVEGLHTYIANGIVVHNCHHVLIKNKWGKAVDMFPNAIGLGVTATPTRADGAGLGSWCGGVFDEMIEGPQMRTLIEMGYLTDYRVFAPPSDIDLTNVNITASGDYSPAPLKKAVQKSHVIGDVVKHYLRIAPGKLGITFATDVETATDIAREFNRAGVPAEVVHAGTLDTDRVDIIKRFKNRELLQLVNVDLFGEGFDLPAIEVVSMARPTQSYSLFVQQFGRALRLMISKILSGAWDTYTDAQRRAFIAESSKPHAIIIDHVGNVHRHNLPDKPQVWTLDGGKRNKKLNTDEIPTKTCVNPECLSVYEAIKNKCPYCGTKPVPAGRASIEFVDGDLLELDPETLAEMRGEIAEVDKDKELARVDAKNKYMPKVGEYAHVNRHVERQEMQTALRESIKWWGAYQRQLDRDDSESYRRFYFRFGIDILTAQSLNKKDALVLAEKINIHLGELAI